MLAYLEHQQFHEIGVFVSGGYVRDLLLGRTSQDLDLSLCLRECAEAVTIETVVEGMPAFAKLRPELAVTSVELIGQLSKAAQGKSMDSAQVRLTVCDHAVTIDMLPTIGDETYDETDRIPHRDVRGTPEQDALRRDLTIGAMLLHVTRTDAPFEAVSRAERLRDARGIPPEILARSMQAAEEAMNLRYRLLDFQGGLDDLRARVLRSPYPRDRKLTEVWAEVMVGSKVDPERQRELTTMLVAGRRVASGARDCDLVSAAGDWGGTGTGPVGAAGSWEGASWDAGVDEETAVQPWWELEGSEETMLQVVWWIKCLRDDPLRLVRAMRFSATLNFRVHSSFWLAVPFAVDALRTKVAGPRKMAELYKVAKSGRCALLAFFELTFRPLADFGDEVMFGDALFGGPSVDSTRLSVAQGFDGGRMRQAAAALPSELSADAAIGAVFAAAVLCSDLKRCSDPSVACAATLDEEEEDGPEGSAAALEWWAARSALRHVPIEDSEAAAAAAISREEVVRACDGLCAPVRMRAACVVPLDTMERLLRQPAAQRQHVILAAALRRLPRLAEGAVPEDARAEGVVALLRVWDLLKLDPALSDRRPEVGAAFVIGLARTRCAESTVARLERQLRLLSRSGPSLSGRAVAGLEGVPSHLRSQFIAQLHVLGRLCGDETSIETSEQLEVWLGKHFSGLLGRLRAEWWEEGEGDGGKRRVREAYSKKASQAWLHQ